MKQRKVYNHSRNIVESKKPASKKSVTKSPYERKIKSIGSDHNMNDVFIQDLTVGGQIKGGNEGTTFQNDIVFDGNVTCNANFQVLSETVSAEENGVGATTIEFAVIADESEPGKKKTIIRKGKMETIEADTALAIDSTTETMTATTTTTETMTATTLTATDSSMETMTASTSIELGTADVLAAAKEARKQGISLEETSIGATTIDYVVLTANGSGRFGRNMRVGTGTFNGSPTVDQTEIADGTVTTDAVVSNSLDVTSGTVADAPTTSTDIANKAYVDSYHPPLLFSKIKEAVSPIKSDETLITKTEILSDGNYSVNAYVNIATESGNTDFVCYLKHNDQKLNEAKHKFAFRGANHTNMHIFDDISDVKVGDTISLCATTTSGEGKIESGHLRVKFTHH